MTAMPTRTWDSLSDEERKPWYIDSNFGGKTIKERINAGYLPNDWAGETYSIGEHTQEKQLGDIKNANEDFLNMKYGLDNNEEKLDHIYKQVSKNTPKTPEVEKPVDTDNSDMLAYIEQKDPEVHGSIILAANADGYEDVDSMVKDAQNTAIKEIRDSADNVMFKEQYTKEHDKEMSDMGLVSDGEVSEINAKETITSFDGKHITVPPSEAKAPKVPREQLVKLGEEKKQAEKYHGISMVTQEEYLAGKDLTGDAIINDLHRNIELMGQGSLAHGGRTSFEVNIAMKSQALQNISKLLGASKVHPEAYSRLSEVFPDINFENPKEAYMLLRYKVQSAAQELVVAYNEQSSPEGKWNKFVVDIGQEHFSEKIESTLDLHEFVEDVINDRDYKIYSRAEQSKIFSMYKSLMGEKKNFFTEVKEDAAQRNLLDVRTQAIDNAMKDIPAIRAAITFRESGWNFLALDPSDYGKLQNGEPLPTKSYRDAITFAENKFVETFNKTIPDSVDPDSDNYAEQRLKIIQRFHNLMEKDAQGIVIGVRADAMDDVIGYSTLISAILDTQNKVNLSNENPFLTAAGKDLLDRFTIFGNLDLDITSSEYDADLAQGGFASIVILKEIFKGTTPIQQQAIADMLGITGESAKVLSFLSYALTEAFDNAAQGTLGRLGTALRQDDPKALKKYWEQYPVDLTIVQSVMNMLTASRSEPQGIGGISDYLEGDATGGAFYKYNIDTMVANKGSYKGDNEFLTWGENTVRYFTRSRISFPAKDSEREKGWIDEVKKSGIYSKAQLTELLSLGKGSESQRQLMYIVHLQTLLRFSDKDNQNRLSSIDKVAMMLKSSGRNTYDTGIQTVFGLLALDVKPGVYTEDGTVHTDSTIELPKQGKQPIGLSTHTITTHRLSDSEDDDSLDNAVKHWGNNGVNLARSVSRAMGYLGRVWTEMGKSGGGIATKPGDYGGLSSESYASQTKSIVDGHNAAEADMNTMTQTLRSNMSYARWMDYAIDLGISEADWNTMVGNAINKTFDPVREKLRGVLGSNKDRFTYGNEQAHLSVLYYVLEEAGGKGWKGIKAEHLRPTAQTNRGKQLNPQQIVDMESRRTAQKERLLKTITLENRNKIVSIMQQSSWGQKKDYSSITNDELVLDYFSLRLDPGAQAIDQNRKEAPILGFSGTTIGVHRDGTRLVLQLKGQPPIALPWSTEPDGNLPEQSTKDFSVDFGSPALLDQAKTKEQADLNQWRKDFYEWADEDQWSWTESVGGVPLSLNPAYWLRTSYVMSGVYKDALVDTWDFITDGYWGSQSQEEVDELLLKELPVNKEEYSEQAERWATQGGYTGSDDPLFNVTIENEAYKIQALDEAREAGASDEEINDIATRWYMPDGGLRQLGEEAMETAAPASEVDTSGLSPRNIERLPSVGRTITDALGIVERHHNWMGPGAMYLVKGTPEYDKIFEDKGYNPNSHIFTPEGEKQLLLWAQATKSKSNAHPHGVDIASDDGPAWEAHLADINDEIRDQYPALSKEEADELITELRMWEGSGITLGRSAKSAWEKIGRSENQKKRNKQTIEYTADTKEERAVIDETTFDTPAGKFLQIDPNDEDIWYGLRVIGGLTAVGGGFEMMVTDGRAIDSVIDKVTKVRHGNKAEWVSKLRKAKAFKLLQAPGRLEIVKKASKLLGKRFAPLTIPLMLWGSYEEAKEIADKLTKNELETLERLQKDIDSGTDRVTAQVINQLANFARSPGTKF